MKYKLKLKFIIWFHSFFAGKYCWAECVAWAYSPTRINPFLIQKSFPCAQESEDDQIQACYCGSWQNGVCFDTLSKKQQEMKRAEMRIVHELEAGYPSDLPF